MNVLVIVSVTTIVMLMALDQTSITTEARHLRKTNGQDHFKAGSTDDFAPTSPGNSPGIGHKKSNVKVEGFQDNFKSTEGRRLQKTNGQDHFKTGTTNDFAPTTPGHSPGIGHKQRESNVEGFKNDFKHMERRMSQNTNGKDHFETGTTDDFAPTTPGHSPGIGHKQGEANVEGLKDAFKQTEGRMLQNTNSQNHFKTTDSMDDFAPTFPGHSPGVGHKKGNAYVKGLKNDFESTEERRLQKKNGQDHFMSRIGHKKEDDLKPTTPRHGFGVGHAIKNDEPKT